MCRYILLQKDVTDKNIIEQMYSYTYVASAITITTFIESIRANVVLLRVVNNLANLFKNHINFSKLYLMLLLSV